MPAALAMIQNEFQLNVFLNIIPHSLISVVVGNVR